MTSVGPFSVHVVAVFIAALAAWLVARFVQRRQACGQRSSAASLVLDALLIGLVAARVTYVLRWWPEYAAAPMSIVSIGDGGFDWWGGLPAALAFVWWKSRGAHALRRPMLAGIAAGMVAWGAAQGVLNALNRAAPPLPDLPLATLHADSIPLRSYIGKPLVVNLWATWCPPCRREMPVLARAQAGHPDVAFLLINQGEDAQVVRAFLEHQGLQFSHVLLDPHSQVMRAMGARALPTTLFFDAQGRMVDSHMGEITAARLADIVKQRLNP